MWTPAPTGIHGPPSLPWPVARNRSRAASIASAAWSGPASDRQEQPDHLVADELVDDAVAGHQGARGLLVEPAQEALEGARSHLLREAGRPADVGEQHAELDLGAAACLLQLLEAEAADRGVLVPPAAVDHPHERCGGPGKGEPRTSCSGVSSGASGRSHGPRRTPNRGRSSIRFHIGSETKAAASSVSSIRRQFRGVAHVVTPERPPRASRSGSPSP